MNVMEGLGREDGLGPSDCYIAQASMFDLTGSASHCMSNARQCLLLTKTKWDCNLLRDVSCFAPRVEWLVIDVPLGYR